jgi:hypothetical protein
MEQDDSLAGGLSLSVMSLRSCFGVMRFQSLAQRSAPKTTIPRDCKSSSVACVDSKPGNRKSGVPGVVEATPRSAISTAEMP